MEDHLYKLSAVQRSDGQWQLHATALATKNFAQHYPPIFFCDHEPGAYHRTEEEALTCPTYPQFLQQIG